MTPEEMQRVIDRKHHAILSYNLQRGLVPWWRLRKRAAMRREIIAMMADFTVSVAEWLDELKKQQK